MVRLSSKHLAWWYLPRKADPSKPCSCFWGCFVCWPGSRLWDNATSSRAGALLLYIGCQVNTASELLVRCWHLFRPEKRWQPGAGVWCWWDHPCDYQQPGLQDGPWRSSDFNRPTYLLQASKGVRWHGAPQNVYRLGTVF